MLHLYYTRISQVTTAINHRTHRDVDSSEDFYLKKRNFHSTANNLRFSQKTFVKTTTCHMYIPAGRSEPRTEDLQLLKWIRLCTGSDVMDEKVYWKELGCKKNIFLCQNVIFVVRICLITVLFVNWCFFPEVRWIFFFMKVWVMWNGGRLGGKMKVFCSLQRCGGTLDVWGSISKCTLLQFLCAGFIKQL